VTGGGNALGVEGHCPGRAGEMSGEYVHALAGFLSLFDTRSLPANRLS